MFVIEDKLAIDMIRSLKTYRRTKCQVARVAQAAAISVMAEKLKEYAAQDGYPKPPPMPRTTSELPVIRDPKPLAA